MSKWHDGIRRAMTPDDHALWLRVKRRALACGICGAAFDVGDDYRWVYCNGDQRSTGNFFTCTACDGDDVKARRLALYDEYRRLDRIVGRGEDTP